MYGCSVRHSTLRCTSLHFMLQWGRFADGVGVKGWVCVCGIAALVMSVNDISEGVAGRASGVDGWKDEYWEWTKHIWSWLQDKGGVNTSVHRGDVNVSSDHTVVIVENATGSICCLSHLCCAWRVCPSLVVYDIPYTVIMHTEMACGCCVSKTFPHVHFISLVFVCVCT